MLSHNTAQVTTTVSGFTGSNTGWLHWFLFSEMREGMQRSDDGGLGFKWRMGEWTHELTREDGRMTNELPTRFDSRVTGSRDP
jgi:hypothetical protein